MPDSPIDASPEPDAGTPAPAAPPGAPQAATGGASPPKPMMPPQGGPMAAPAKELGNIAKGTQMAKAALHILEEAWSMIRSKDEVGQVIFDVIGKLTKALHESGKDDKNAALMASMRKQMTQRPGQQMPPAQGGAPPSPPTGPIPQPGGAPGPQGA